MDHTVSASRDAHRPTLGGDRAAEAGLGHAYIAAAIAVNKIPVVALLNTIDGPVSAYREASGSLGNDVGAHKAGFNSAGKRTAVTANCVPIVTAFVNGADGVSTERAGRCRPDRKGARVTGFNGAGCRAAVAGNGVPVVTAFC